jgi:hypothetical protein
LYYPYFVERDVTGKLPVLEASVGGGGWTLELGTGKPGDPPIAIDSVPVDDASNIFEVDVGAWGSDTVVNVPVS